MSVFALCWGRKLWWWPRLALLVSLLVAPLAVSRGQPPAAMFDYLTAEMPYTSETPSASPNLFPTDSAYWTVASVPAESAAELRAEKFEADFGVKQPSPSLVKSSLETAQYKLDETVFAAKEFVENFRYDTYLADLTTESGSIRPPRRYYSDPVMDAWEHCQIRSGAEWDEKTGHAFVGVRLVLPFGD